MISKSPKLSRRRKTYGAVSLLAIAGLALSSCAGDTGEADADEASAETEGFEYGASQEEVNEAIADLEPVTLTFQNAAPSENAPAAQPVLKFMEAVEERSNGQITIEPIWSMSVANYPEVVDALQDGRIDMSYHLVGYEPQRFPEATDIGSALASTAYSPMVGEMTAYAVGAELGWQNQGLLDSYEAEGLTPFVPFVANGAYSLSCNSELSTADDMEGAQIRAGSLAQAKAVEHFNATPTSIEFAEAFEALQRGTIDCDLSPMGAKEISGVYEAAPHLGYTTQASWPRFPAAYLAGSTFQELPLAYQQIIFDSQQLGLGNDVGNYINSNALFIDDTRSIDGTINEFDQAMQDELANFITVLQDEAIEAGTIDADTVSQIEELDEKWSSAISEMGYEDEGEMDDLNEWYDPETNYDEFSWAVYEESGALEHRPGANNGN